MKFVGDMKKWAQVAAELQGEDLKEKIYDNTLLGLCGSLKGKTVLDYGAGPAVIAGRAFKMGAQVKTFDISRKMNAICVDKLGNENVFLRLLKFRLRRSTSSSVTSCCA